MDAQDFPGKRWKKFTSAEEAGFSSEKLKLLDEALQKNGSAVFLIIKDGKVVYDWGDINRRFRQASIRKSYLNAVFGIFHDKNNWDLNQTLSDLKIDDINPLTETEKQARIYDLLASRSGIYLPAAYTTKSNIERMPSRGSHAPGTFWYYNNWDFNTLHTIFEKKSQASFFEEFQQKIALPLQMEDFRTFDTYYRLEENRSKHPAYLFKMTARDMARFGLLYLNNGKWKQKQIVGQEWIKKSLEKVSTDLGAGFGIRGAYGLLWWISKGIDGHPMYYASGAGGQRICIFPDDNMVVVHLVDTYQDRSVGESQIQDLLALMLNAKTGNPKSKPKSKPYALSPIKYHKEPMPKDLVAKVAGTYQHRFLGTFKMEESSQGMVMTTNIGRFHIYKGSGNQFIVEDMLIPLEFQKGTKEQKSKIEAKMNPTTRSLEKVIFYY